jgi:hypothetical protein
VSRATHQIKRQAESQGWAVTRIEWEPIGIGAEKSGPSGGWDVDLVRDGITEWAGGYNVAQVIQWIKNFDLPYPHPDPFACSGKYHSLVAGDCTAARGHKGDHYPFVPRSAVSS